LEKVCGIYLITNLINSHQYVGKDSHIDKKARWKRHLLNFKRKDHANIYFQRSWYKYGKENFSYKIIEYCSEEELSEREVYWIKELNTQIPNGYNITPGGDGGGSMTGRHLSNKTKKKISIARKGAIVSDETKKKISETLLGHEVSKETRKKRSVALKGVPKSKEHGNNLSNSKRGQKSSNKGSSIYVGVSYDKRAKKWRAAAIFNRIKKNLGVYEDQTDAAQAYDLAILEYYGLNSRINFPNKLEDYKEILELK